MAASTVAELRKRVDRAAGLMDEVGNVRQLARLLFSACYAALCMREEHEARRFVERAIPITRTLDDPFMWMLLQGNVGLTALLTGDIDAAEQALGEEIRLARELVVSPVAAEGLIGLAAIAEVRGDHPRAAHLVGAAKAHQYGVQQDDIVDTLHARFFRRARALCGPAAWDAAAREGAALSFEDAVAYALEECPPRGALSA